MAIRIGIDVGGTKIEGIALDGSLDVGRTRVATPRGNYAATVGAIAEVVAALEQHTPPGSRFSGAPVATVGVGIPGALSPSTGLVKNANSSWLIGKPLQRDLEARLGRPVRIANDANCFAVSEAADGAGAGADVVFGVIVGTGTGGGIVVKGWAMSGPNAIAGEWGHNPLPWAEADDVPGPPCYCGRRGCIETFLSGPGLAAEFEHRAHERAEPPDIVARAAAGDRAAEATLACYEHRMARALAAVINLLDPDVIVLGGGVSNIDRLYVNVPRLWSAFVFAADGERLGTGPESPETGSPISRADARVKTRLVRAHHGDASGVRGAAWLWEDMRR